jgi:hypothetical protein
VTDFDLSVVAELIIVIMQTLYCEIFSCAAPRVAEVSNDLLVRCCSEYYVTTTMSLERISRSSIKLY